MRLFSIFSLIVFTLCILLINGQFYQPQRNGDPEQNRKIDTTYTGCKDACNRACEANCKPAELCQELGADITRSRTKCTSCICPEGTTLIEKNPN